MKDVIKAVLIALLVLAIIFGLLFIDNSHVMKPLPEDGEWYCDELKMEISFSPGFMNCSAKQYADDGSYAMLEIHVDWGNRFLISEKREDMEWGENLLMGEFFWRDNILVIFNELEGGRGYGFYRVEE